jgi:CubicO group peptidase (beta-lactamase class C family)
LRKIFTFRKLLMVGCIVIGLIVLLMMVWISVAGPVTVLRIIRYGDTKIDDHLHYPARHLAASERPYQFSEKDDILNIQVPSPDESGSSTDLDEMLEVNDTIAFLVLKNDQVIIERYYQGTKISDRSQAFSMSKSFTSLLIGMAITDGYIQSVDQPVTDFIPELFSADWSNVTIKHLLTMTSGSTYIENDNPFGIHVILNYTPHLEDKILSFRMKDEPGVVWRYKSGDNALLGLILQRVLTPKSISEYTQERLWTPLGMEYEGLWSLDREHDGLEKTWCCMSAAARDYLKIGKLYLEDGQWEGRQIVPSSWVQASTQVGAVPEDSWDADFRRIGVWNYGYQWWLLDKEKGSYLANGKDGQYLYIDPSTQTVILRLGWSMGKMPLSQWIRLFDYISEELN